MNTSGYSNLELSYRIARYLAFRTLVGILRLFRWAFVHTLLTLDGLLGYIASPLSSGRDENEFKDMVQPDSPEHTARHSSNPNGFWSFYFQAYTPRLWRMRRLMSMSVGRNYRKNDGGDVEEDQ